MTELFATEYFKTAGSKVTVLPDGSACCTGTVKTKTAMPFVQPGRTTVPGALGAAAFGGAAGLGGVMAADRMMAPPTPMPQFAPIPPIQERILSGQEPIHPGVSLPLNDPRLGNVMGGPHVRPEELGGMPPDMTSDMSGMSFADLLQPH